MAELAGCSIEAFNSSASSAAFAWITGASPAPSGFRSGWLLAYCNDGVTWGRFDQNTARWRLASEAFPRLAPKPAEENLQELRLFGTGLELLIWREASSFRGRILRDVPSSPGPFFPMNENRILLGDRLLEGSRDGFSRVGSPTGAEQVVPLSLAQEDFRTPWPLRLQVRHYLEADDETGAVRIAATRLVALEVKSR